MPGTIRSLLRNERPRIRSDGSFVRDYVYVRDAARAYMDLAQAVDVERVAGEAFNFGLESPITVRQLVDEIRRLMGREDVEPEIENRAVGEIRDQYLSARKAREVLGWTPRYELEPALRETIDWYREFLG